MLENPARSPAQRLARRLLAEAKSCPALVHRSRDSSTVTKGRSGRSFPAMALLSEPALDIRQYLEDLVTIAVGSAQQARDMLIEARKVNRTAWRRVAVVASFGALGLIVGIAGLTASHSANVKLSEVREEVRALQKLGQDIASLQQQRKAEEAAFARQQAAREALLQQIADLQQQTASLRDQVARGSRDVNTVAKPSPSIEALRPAQEASAADNSVVREAGQHNIISLQQQTYLLAGPSRTTQRRRRAEAGTQSGAGHAYSPEAARAAGGGASATTSVCAISHPRVHIGSPSSRAHAGGERLSAIVDRTAMAHDGTSRSGASRIGHGSDPVGTSAGRARSAQQTRS